ncbi:unnamed protein product [Prorocentrum cordatum]|uniref:Uncharacterized protein n=1 Tax=Prorocentrum cordatum TaxID=2364126 RepID=A0ABN9SKD2_9DINO|nr:unnamed protein product [Polarella glacialis]
MTCTCARFFWTSQGILIESSEVEVAAMPVRRRRALDHYGCSAMGLQIACQEAGEAVASLLSKIASIANELADIDIIGRVAAEDRGPVCSARLRIICPLPVVLIIFGCIVTARMHAIIDEIVSQVDPCFLECARRCRQVMEIASPMSMVIEKWLRHVFRSSGGAG